MSITKTVYQESVSEPKKDYRFSLSLTASIRTLWLFTESDFVTFVIPDTAFAIFGALAGPVLTTNTSPSLTILARLPAVLLWNWLNLLIFDLANQRLPDAVVEDSINKPWRPLPSGRLTTSQATRLLLVALPAVLTTNYLLGAWKETALLFTLTWMYNDLDGGEHFLVRNLIIAFAFALYNGGALKVACGPNVSIVATGYTWTAVVSAVIFSTMHVQDMKDQAGDLARKRNSAPLALGDRVARWTIAVPVLIWSIVCPLFWRLGPKSFIMPLSLGVIVAIRVLWLRSVEADRVTWQIWTAWTACLYFLPLIKDHHVFTDF